MARERLAQAEATATRLVAQAVAEGGETALRYFISDKYVAAFQAIAASPHSRLVIVPMEASALAGGITQALSLLQVPAAARPAGGSVPATPPVRPA
jgi:regulator of protease activity HflC (stomatin/prohibitin superfamily)